MLSWTPPGETDLGAELFRLEKICNVAVGRMAHKIGHGIDLVEFPVMHYRDAVGERDAVCQIVRDIKRRKTVLAVERQDFLTHLKTIGRIEVAKGLVHQHDARRGRHCPTQCDALLLAAGQLRGLPTEKTCLDPDLIGQRTQESGYLFARPFPHFERKRQISVCVFIEDPHMRPEGKVLKYHLHVALARGNVVDRHAADENGAAIGAFKTGDEL